MEIWKKLECIKIKRCGSQVPFLQNSFVVRSNLLTEHSPCALSTSHFVIQKVWRALVNWVNWFHGGE